MRRKTVLKATNGETELTLTLNYRSIRSPAYKKEFNEHFEVLVDNIVQDVLLDKYRFRDITYVGGKK
jgi:hypothetical protein